MPQPSLSRSLFCLTIPHTPNPTINTHTHTPRRFLLLISLCCYREIAEGIVRDADIQLSAISLEIYCFPLSFPLNVSVPSLSMPLFFLPRTPSLYTSLLSYFITLTPTPATLMHMPLDSSPPSSHHPLPLIHSINHSPHSCFFTSSALLYVLPPSTYSSIGNSMSCPPTPV